MSNDAPMETDENSNILAFHQKRYDTWQLGYDSAVENLIIQWSSGASEFRPGIASSSNGNNGSRPIGTTEIKTSGSETNISSDGISSQQSQKPKVDSGFASNVKSPSEKFACSSLGIELKKIKNQPILQLEVISELDIAEHAFNLLRTATKKFSKSTDVIVMNDEDLKKEWSEACDKILQEWQKEYQFQFGDLIRQRFRDFVDVHATNIITINTVRKEKLDCVKQQLPAVIDKVQNSFCYEWVGKTREEIRALCITDDSPELKLAQITGPKGKMQFVSLLQPLIDQAFQLCQALKKCEDGMSAFLEENIYTADNQDLKAFWETANALVNSTAPSNLLKIKANSVLGVILRKYTLKNDDATKQEVLVAEKARKYAVEKTKDILKQAASENFGKFESAETELVNALVNCFFSVSDFVYTPAWEAERTELEFCIKTVYSEIKSEASRNNEFEKHMQVIRKQERFLRNYIQTYYLNSLDRRKIGTDKDWEIAKVRGLVVALQNMVAEAVKNEEKNFEADDCRQLFLSALKLQLNQCVQEYEETAVEFVHKCFGSSTPRALSESTKENSLGEPRRLAALSP